MANLKDLVKEESKEVLGDRPDLTPEQAEKIASEPDVAMLTQILTQGRFNAQINEMLMFLPKDRYPVLVRRNPSDMNHYMRMGFRVESSAEIAKHSPTFHGGDGTDQVIVGDTILMTCSTRNIEAIRKIEEGLLFDKLDLNREEYMSKSLAVADQTGVVPFDATVKSSNRR